MRAVEKNKPLCSCLFDKFLDVLERSFAVVVIKLCATVIYKLSFQPRFLPKSAGR